MKLVETTHGYDIYELSEQECKESFYEYPTYAVFVEGENRDMVGFEEDSEGSLEEARKWCEKYSRNSKQPSLGRIF